MQRFHVISSRCFRLRLSHSQISSVPIKQLTRRYATPPGRASAIAPEFKFPWLKALELRDKQEKQPATTSEKPLSKPLVGKRMSDSFTSYTLEFGKDEWLVDAYVNATGQLRLGTIFMDLDSLAGAIAYKHAGEGATIVTAAVDRITLLHSPTNFCDMEMRGMVTWTSGRSSMEISLEVVTKDDNKTVMTCQFTMVALDPNTKKATPVNTLLVETAEEKRIFARGEERNKFKKTLASASLDKQEPNDEESILIHNMWLENQVYQDPLSGVDKPENIVYMSDTRIQNTQVMQPQYRNRHSYMIFGGLLLRNTFELAFCAAAAASHSRPRFLSMSPSVFRESVPVGGILYLTATVAYTEPTGTGGTRMQIRVDSKVRDVLHSTLKNTGTFTYTFDTETKLDVLPRTYGEFVIYIDARRKATADKALADEGEREQIESSTDGGIVE